MNRLEKKRKTRLQRKLHVRKRVAGTNERPRVSVYKSNCHLVIQAIDDVSNATMVAVSTHESELKSLGKGVAGAEALGTKLAERLKEKSINSIVFDRNGYKYHGVIKALADSVRAGGIQF